MNTSPSEHRNPLIAYLVGAIAELKKVSWPSRKETWKKSWIVIWFSLGFMVFLGVLDYAFTQLLEVVL